MFCPLEGSLKETLSWMVNQKGILDGTVSRFFHWMDAKGHCGMFCPLEGHSRGHFYHVLSTIGASKRELYHSPPATLV